MAKKKKRGGPALQEDLSPNLIPMIDIMFLLLLFLMLGADMGAREFEEVVLPVAQGVKEDKDSEHKSGITTVNIYHKYANEVACAAFREGGICTERSHWNIGVRGTDYDPKSIGLLIKSEADLNRDPKNPAVSERKLMIRADRSAIYEYVQKVIEACALAGLYKIEIGAAEKLGT
jgi:biopolymer transport protein ExbD